jgi:hypothetical protein
VVDVVDDLGLFSVVGVVLLVAAGVVIEIRRRRGHAGLNNTNR